MASSRSAPTAGSTPPTTRRCACSAAGRPTLAGRHMLQLFPELPEYRPLEAARAGRGDRLEGLARRQDGAAFPVELSLRPTVVEDQRLLIAIVRDITAAKAQENRLRHQAVHDALTGLPNRVAAPRPPGPGAAQRAPASGKPLALLLLDLDRFKEINDTLGHHVGRPAADPVRRAPAATASATATRSPASAATSSRSCCRQPPTVERAWPVARAHRATPSQQPFEVIERPAPRGRGQHRHRAVPRARRRRRRACCNAPTSRCTPPRSGAGPVQLYDRDKDQQHDPAT